MKNSWPFALLVSVLSALLFLKVLSSHDWDPLAFVLLTPSDAVIGQTNNIGYDGRFTYHIAVNDFGDTNGLDEPNFRYQRILYPLIVRALSLGNPAWVPWAMLAVNIAAGGLIANLLGKLLIRREVFPGWSLIVVFSVGYLIALRFDLIEPLALVFLLSGLLAYERGRLMLASLVFAVGGLAKEFVLLAPVTLAACELFQRRPKAAAALALNLVPFALWYLYLVGRFGLPPAAVEKSLFSWLPLSGFALQEDSTSRWVVSIWAVFPALIFGGWALLEGVGNFWRGLGFTDQVLVVAYAGLILILPGPTWVDPMAVLRWALGFMAVLVIWLAGSHPRVLPYAAALWLPSGLMLSLVPGMF